MIKVLHLITGLSVGGAETMLFKLLSQIDRNGFEPEVLSLTDIGPIGKRIQGLGVPVDALRMPPGRPSPITLLRFARRLRHRPPDIIQTWMYHADLVGAVGATLAGGIPTVWNIRHTNISPQANKRTHIWTARVCALMSHRLPKRIICNSETSRQEHIKLGYAAGKMQVIPNGFDLATFKPDAAARRSVCQELQISEQSLLIGLVARFDRQKDHHTFVQAAERLKSLHHVRFLLCGDGISGQNEKLVQWINRAGIQDRCHLLGRRDDIPRLTAALDIATSSSVGEAFSNAIGEAMACAVPCAVTDVGDSAWIVGDTGRVVRPADAEALAKSWLDLIEIGEKRRREFGLAARRRVEENFNLPNIVRRYENLYEEIAGDRCADLQGSLTR